METSKRLKRWLAPLLAGVGWLLLLVLAGWSYLQLELVGTFTGLMAAAITTPVVRIFLWKLLVTEVLPLYLGGAFLLWPLLLLIGSLIPGLSDWRRSWSFRDGFWGAWTLLGVCHLGLWWQVPTTLWVFPGFNRLPFWLLFPLLTGLILGPWLALAIRRFGLPKGLSLGLLSLGLGMGLAYLPHAFKPKWQTTSESKGPRSRMLMVAVDGLRRDVAVADGIEALKGLHVPTVYSPLPATRMVYSLLWGGDPLRYTSSAIIPDLEELEGKVPYVLLEEAKAKGQKARFFIDDAGTIGLMGRNTGLDELGMPAPGWESFVDSNFGAFLPLYASWLNELREFPGTNPWSAPDEGLIEALNRGRGADWVMFHSCLTHQPIFLDRRELSSLGRWWTLSPRSMRPLGTIAEYVPGMENHWDPRRDPMRAYKIRVKSLLDSWIPILNSLAKDRDYQDAVRVFFSDHGEHFFRLVGEVRLQGIHGFNPDPWELKVPFVLSGPGITEDTLDPKPRSLLMLKGIIRESLKGGDNLVPRIRSHMEAPERITFRYLVPDLSTILPMQMDYKVTSFQTFIDNVYVGPGGRWGMAFNKILSERKLDHCVAVLDPKEHLTVYKPLKAGGAHKVEYQGEQFVKDCVVSEEDYQKIQEEVTNALTTPHEK